MCHQNKLTNLQQKTVKVSIKQILCACKCIDLFQVSKDCSIVDINHIHMLGGTNRVFHKFVPLGD